MTRRRISRTEWRAQQRAERSDRSRYRGEDEGWTYTRCGVCDAVYDVGPGESYACPYTGTEAHR